MALSDLVKSGPVLGSDGMIEIYDVNTGKVVAQYEGLQIHEKLVQADMWKKESQALLEMTMLLCEFVALMVNIPEREEG